jgi:hypothetical protein
MAIRRSLAFILVLLTVAALVHFWPDGSERADSPAHPSQAQQNVTSASSSESTTAIPSVPHALDTRRAEERAVQRRTAQIDVRVPASVRTGESFQATVDLDAAGGIRRLAFTLNFNNTVIQLLRSSTGTFVESAGLPARLDVQEPSDGVVLVTLDVDHGMTIGGVGSVVVLEFRATNAGASRVTLDDVTLVESDGADTSMKPSIHQGLVAVE